MDEVENQEHPSSIEPRLNAPCLRAEEWWLGLSWIKFVTPPSSWTDEKLLPRIYDASISVQVVGKDMRIENASIASSFVFLTLKRRQMHTTSVSVGIFSQTQQHIT
jgi:hypothetical protein